MDQLNISDVDSKIIRFTKIISIKDQQLTPSMQSLVKITFISHNLFKINML